MDRGNDPSQAGSRVRRVTVYASSSNALQPACYEAAGRVGDMIDQSEQLLDALQSALSWRREAAAFASVTS